MWVHATHNVFLSYTISRSDNFGLIYWISPINPELGSGLTNNLLVQKNRAKFGLTCPICQNFLFIRQFGLTHPDLRAGWTAIF